VEGILAVGQARHRHQARLAALVEIDLAGGLEVAGGHIEDRNALDALVAHLHRQLPLPRLPRRLGPFREFEGQDRLREVKGGVDAAATAGIADVGEVGASGTVEERPRLVAEGGALLRIDRTDGADLLLELRIVGEILEPLQIEWNAAELQW